MSVWPKSGVPLRELVKNANIMKTDHIDLSITTNECSVYGYRKLHISIVFYTFCLCLPVCDMLFELYKLVGSFHEQ